jgi:hypothetical protein
VFVRSHLQILCLSLSSLSLTTYEAPHTHTHTHTHMNNSQTHLASLHMSSPFFFLSISAAFGQFANWNMMGNVCTLLSLKHIHTHTCTHTRSPVLLHGHRMNPPLSQTHTHTCISGEVKLSYRIDNSTIYICIHIYIYMHIYFVEKLYYIYICIYIYIHI